jgi:hypothetical protein
MSPSAGETAKVTIQDAVDAIETAKKELDGAKDRHCAAR